jgi:hypothetical protein
MSLTASRPSNRYTQHTYCENKHKHMLTLAEVMSTGLSSCFSFRADFLHKLTYSIISLFLFYKGTWAVLFNNLHTVSVYI